MADRPILDIEAYVDELVTELNNAAHRASLGERHPVVLRLTCEIHADEELAKDIDKESERIRSSRR
jgi:hypothetical protein